MTAEESSRFSHQARLAGQPPGFLNKLLAFILTAGLLAIGLMFSVLAVAVLAVAGITIGGCLWWKTRTLRKQMRTSASPSAAYGNGDIIEGEVIRRTNE